MNFMPFPEMHKLKKFQVLVAPRLQTQSKTYLRFQVTAAQRLGYYKKTANQSAGTIVAMK